MVKEVKIVNAGLILWLIGFALLLCVCPTSAISFNVSEKTENNILLNVTHEGEYSVFLNEESKYTSNSDRLVFSDLNPSSSYLIRIMENNNSYSEIVKTEEASYGGISLSTIVLFLIWMIVFVLGYLYMPFLLIIDIIPIVIMLTDKFSGIETPLLKFLFAMLIPATILVFGWRVSE